MEPTLKIEISGGFAWLTVLVAVMLLMTLIMGIYVMITGCNFIIHSEGLIKIIKKKFKRQ